MTDPAIIYVSNPDGPLVYRDAGGYEIPEREALQAVKDGRATLNDDAAIDWYALSNGLDNHGLPR